MSPQIGICGFKDSDKFKAINHPFLEAERTYAELFHEQLCQSTKYHIIFTLVTQIHLSSWWMEICLQLKGLKYYFLPLFCLFQSGENTL